MKKTDRNKLKPGNLVIIHWEDITESINDKFEENHTATCLSVGWVIETGSKNTIEYVKIKSSDYTDEEHKGTGTSSPIPLGCIFKVERIKNEKG